MELDEAIYLWEREFPEAARVEVFPEDWVMRMWSDRYTESELEYALTVSRSAMEKGRLEKTVEAVSKYTSGVLRKTRKEANMRDAFTEPRTA